MSMSLSNALQDQFFAAMLGLGIAIGMTPAASASERIDMHAAAAMGSVTRTTLVRVADLNLGDPTAAKTLETRLKVAAGKVCDKDSLWTLRPPADYVRCFDAALAGARAQLAQRMALGDNAPIYMSMR